MRIFYINTMHHADASLVKVSLWEQDGCLCMAVADDGKGFDVDQHKESAGLLSMRERINSINGELQVDSIVGKGTCISIMLKTQ